MEYLILVRVASDDPVLQSGFDFQNFGFNFQLAGALCLSATLLQGIYFGVPFACTYGVSWALSCKAALTFRILGSGRRAVPFKFQPLFYKEYILEYLLLVHMG